MNIYNKNKLTGIVLYILFGISAGFAQTAESPLARLEASRAENIGAYSANTHGVYPVRLRWQKPSDGIERNYQVYRSVAADTGFEKISADSDIKNEGSFFIFIDKNTVALPEKPYYYRIMTVNSTGAASPFSGISMGYGALSHECYLREYSKTLRASHQKLTLMHKPSAMNKLGSEQIQGAISGTLSYDAKIERLVNGRVIMEYNRYAEFYFNNDKTLGPIFILSGNMNTTSSITLNGKMDGTVNISGMYPGRVFYDKVEIKNGAAGGGTYGVEPQGFPRMEMDWKIGEP